MCQGVMNNLSIGKILLVKLLYQEKILHKKFKT
jgi:hypothetical protein